MTAIASTKADTGVVTAEGSRARLRAATLLLAALVLLTPAVASVSLVRYRLGASPFDCVPVINDEIAFWQEIATFRVAGFHGGYHTTNELMAPARFCHFDPKGPGYPVLYGLLASVLGWEYWSGPAFHLLCVAAATLFWVWYCRPSRRVLAVVALLVAVWWPFLLWLPTTMPEGLHFALAFLLAAVVQRACTNPPANAVQFLAPMLLIAACAFLRLTWGVLLLPWAVLGLRGFSARGRVLGCLSVAAVALALFAVSRRVNAPHPLPEGIGTVAWLFDMAKRSPGEARDFFLGHARWNFRNLIQPDGGKPLEVLHRYVLLAFLFVGLASLVTSRVLRNRDPDRVNRWLFACLNLGPLIVAMVLVYDVAEWRDYRVTAPHLFASCVVVAAGAAWRWVLGLSVVQLLFLPAFLAQYTELHRERVTWDRELMATFRAEVQDVLRFDPTRSPWDNTIVVSGELVTYPLLGVPAGVGINAVLVPATFRLPPRSRYILMSEEQTADLGRYFRLRRIARTRMGWLSENLDAPRRRDGS